MIINDTTGRTPKELAGGYAEQGVAIPAPGVSRAPEDLAVLVMEGGAGFTMVAQPAGAVDYGFARPRYDVSVYRGVRLVADVLSAGSAGAVLKAYYKMPGGTDWLPVSNPATAELSIATVGEHASAAYPLVASCTGDVRFLVKAEGGDGATSPSLRRVAVQLVDVAQRVEDVPVAPSCELLGSGYWSNDWSSYADDAALDAAIAAAAPGEFLYEATVHDGADRTAFLDTTEQFCGHATLRGDRNPSGNWGGWAAGGYFDEYDVFNLSPWPGASLTNVWTRNTWEFPSPTLDSMNFRLVEHVFEGDFGEYIKLNIGAGVVYIEGYSNTDATTDIDLGPSTDLVTGAMVDVITHTRVIGESFRMDVWYGAHGTTPTHRGSLTLAWTDGWTKMIAGFVGDTINSTTAPAFSYWNGRSELHDGTVHANPYGVVIP